MQLEPVGVVNQAIQDGIADGWVREPGMPVNDRHLSGDQGGRPAVAVIQDFEQVLRLGAGEGVAQPVIEDQELSASEGVEEIGVGPVRVGQGELMKEARGAVVADGEVTPASGDLFSPVPPLQAGRSPSGRPGSRRQTR